MAPTSDEELKLRLYTGELTKLGHADKFMKIIVEIPFAFKRLETLLFMCTLPEEASAVKESFKTLEVDLDFHELLACKCPCSSFCCGFIAIQILEVLISRPSFVSRMLARNCRIAGCL